MLLKTKLFRYLIFFFLIVSAKHSEKAWLQLSVVWENLKFSNICRRRNPFLCSSASSLAVIKLTVFLLISLLSSFLCLHCFLNFSEQRFLPPFTIAQHPLCLGYAT